MAGFMPQDIRFLASPIVLDTVDFETPSASAGSQTITKDDPHYGWDLGYFCLSGYTDKGDSEDVYLKKVGNKVKLTFHLDQDIKKLNGNSDFKIESDKNGSDEEFKVPAHNMKHGELIIRHTDSENVAEEVKYSDYLAALASPGADTAIQLFEEGDRNVRVSKLCVFHYSASFVKSPKVFSLPQWLSRKP